MRYEPRYYQTAAHDAAWQWIGAGAGNPLIVLPTGAGKSLVIAMLVTKAAEWGQRSIVLAHRKELLEQNADKIEALAGMKVGRYSAGLKSRDTAEQVICAGIQSCYDRAEIFGERGLIVVDEAHLISGDADSMYGLFLEDMRKLNRKLFLVGLTATPYRTGSGMLAGPDKMFHGVCYEAKTQALIDDGFLSKLTNQASDTKANLKSVAVRGGEFVACQAEAAFTSGNLVHDACCEITIRCDERKSILVFCSGVDHAEQVRFSLQHITGQPVGLITGQTAAQERADLLSAFRGQRLRWLVNCDVLTTGFDAPCIDAVAVLRATMSPGLFAQMVGRGLRTTAGKSDCLILDFGSNLQRHGPLDSGSYGQAKPRNADGSEAPSKKCPKCQNENFLSAVQCSECGYQFVKEMDREGRHGTSVDEESPILGEAPPKWLEVHHVRYNVHEKRGADAVGKPPTLCVTYECKDPELPGGNLAWLVVREFVCFQHTGFAQQKAFQWWQARSCIGIPRTCEQAEELADLGACRKPSRILVKREGKWDRITQVEFIDEKPDRISEPVAVDDEVPF